MRKRQADRKPAASPATKLGPLKGIDRFVKKIAETNEIEGVVEAVVKETARLAPAKTVSLWFLNRSGTYLSRVASVGKGEGSEIAVDSHRAIRNALRTGRLAASKFDARGSIARRLGMKQAIIVPITDGHERFGMLAVSEEPGDSEAQDRRDLVATLAQQASLAIANSTHLRQLGQSTVKLEGHARKLQQLYQTLDRFSDSRTEEEVLKLIPDLACQTLGYNYALTESLKGKRLQLLQVATRKPANEKFERTVGKQSIRDLAPEGLVARALATGQPLAINDPAHDQRIRRGFLRQNFENMAFIPLTYGQEHVGVLLVGRHKGGQMLSPDDLELLSVFSKICGYALSNIRYLNYRQRATDIANIAAGTVEEFAGSVVTQLPGIVGARDAIISLPDENQQLVPVAATNRRLLHEGYRKWLTDLPFSRYNFQMRSIHSESHPNVPEIEGSMTIPIQYEYESENLGMLHVLHRMTGNFTPEDVALMKLHTTRLGYILKNVELVESLGAERRHFASIVHGSADGIISIDEYDRIEFLNPAMKGLTGIRETEAIGKTCTEAFDLRDEESKPFNFDWLSEAAPADRRTTVRNATLRTKGGGRRWVGISAALEVEEGQYTHTIVVVRDITEQYELLKRQQEFVSIASHELRTPITALVGYLSLLENGLRDNSDQVEHFLGRAYKAASRLSELVEDLLHVARIEEGRVAITLKPVHLAEIVNEVVAGLRPNVSRKTQRLTISNRLGKDDTVQADRSKLIQIFGNLVDNAIKYTPEKGVIKVSLSSNKKELVVKVTDSGIGIHPDNIQRIFEKFFREYTELSVTAGGTGLGLFITKELVHRLGGVLEIDSKQGTGTTATVRFPRPGKQNTAS